jgi:hypothetical protein
MLAMAQPDDAQAVLEGLLGHEDQFLAQDRRAVPGRAISRSWWMPD